MGGRIFLMMQGLTLLWVALGLIGSGYILLTGRWIRWPIRPKRMPRTARHRRLVGGGMLLFFAGQTIWYAMLLTDPHRFIGPFQLGLLAPIVTMALTLSAAPLWLLGWRGVHQPAESQPVKHYRIEGWPPPPA